MITGYNTDVEHLLICAAIHAGRVGDLKRMAGAEPEMAVIDTPVDIEPPAPAQVEVLANCRVIAKNQ